MKNPFPILTLGVFTLLVLPPLLMDGMFMDGQQYACVARNFATGVGSFWQPYLSQTWSRAGSEYFMEHPPLIYALQGFFFELFGQSRFVERFYSLLTAVLTAWLIMGCWKLLVRPYPSLSKLSWLPVLLWIITPVAAWAYHHNVHENTMGLFTLAAVYAALSGLSKPKLSSTSTGWIVLSGIFIFAATFSKGVPGLFPLVAFGCFWLSTLVSRRGDWEISFGTTLVYSLLCLAAAALPYFLLMQHPPAAESLSFYFNERLLARVDNEPTVTNRFYTLERLFSELLPAIGLVLLVAMWYHFRYKTKNDGVENADSTPIKLLPQAVFCFLMGFAGSLPLMLTGVQRGFYLTPALPFFGLGLAVLIGPKLNRLIEHFSEKQLKVVRFAGIVILLAALGYSIIVADESKRDGQVLADTYLYGTEIERGSVVGIESGMYDEWGFIFYMLRYFEISTLPTDQPEDTKVQYFVADKQTPFQPSATAFERVYPSEKPEQAEQRFQLYKRK